MSQPVETPVTARAGSAPLQARDLTCLRGETELFAGLTFELHDGEVLQVEGPNGSGKTTLLRALCGLVPLERGHVMWRGVEIGEAGEDFLGALNYIGHAPAVKRELTPLENLAAARALGAGAEAADAHAALARLGLAEAARTPLSRLSAGQRRRVALARLLIAPTPLWVLDEPFTALDRDGRAQVERLIAEHCAGGGLVALSTHHAVRLDAAVKRIGLEPGPEPEPRS